MKGITPVITIILIILIVISATGFVYMMFRKNLSSTEEAVETSLETVTKGISSCIRIEHVNGNKIYIRNCGKGNITELNIYLDRAHFNAKNGTNGWSIVIPEGRVASVSVPETITVPYTGANAVSTIKISSSGTFTEMKLPGEKIIIKDFIIISDRYDKWVYVKSEKDGSFTNAYIVEDMPYEGSWGIAVADFNADGYYDFVSGDNSGRIYFFKNSGINGFSPGVHIGDFNPDVTNPNYMKRAMDMAVADFDNDDDMDFVVSGNNNYYSVFLSNKDGTFTKKTEFSPTGGERGLGKDSADINRDGCKDIVADAKNNGDIWWFPGNCDGTFGEPHLVGTWGNNESYGVIAGDFDNDGINDVLTNPYSKHNHVLVFFKGKGDGNFENPVVVYSHETLHDINAGDAFDVDKDGNLDILYVNYEGNSLFWASGNGDGTFRYRGPVADLGSFDMRDILGIAGPRPFWED
ncbi:MAG: VCBS repeat-containing protein [Candidatus Aenigmarchaeota archaeon]|nr:VCBS repeat-containing protein [Candidatus Aenigmarchaeota archaeon]